jgi:hypothetical protein
MPIVTPHSLERRRLLRAGAVMAGVAAGAVAATTGAATKAEAATGNTLTLGTTNTADQTTEIAFTSSPNTGATLGLSNANSGPTLFLNPESEWDGELNPGEIINTGQGPYIGTLVGEVPTTDYLVTGTDLAFQQVLYSVDPTRLLDTRSDLTNVIGASSNTPFDGESRLKAFQYIDVAVEPANEGYYVDAAFFNLTATRSLSGGYLTAYPPGDRPDISTLNFPKGVSIANGTFVALGQLGDSFALRIFTTATVHVILDYTGASVSEIPGSLAPAAAKKQAAARRRGRSTKRIQTVLGRKTR